jgi:putative FmdB family regulatory protein
MPRYAYKCRICEESTTIFHLADETPGACPKCEDPAGLAKILTTFTTQNKNERRAKIGQVTEEFIKEARRDLKNQKQSLNGEK